MLNIKLWTKLYFDSLIPNYHETKLADKYDVELPLEINKISLLDSIIVCAEDMDDYGGEDVKYEPSLLIDIENEIDSPISPIRNDSALTSNTYFKSVNLKWSLDSLDINTIDDTQIHFELDLDGLFKQKDYIERFSDSNRRCRHLYKSKIESYRRQLEYLQQIHSFDVSSQENNNIETEIDAVSSSSDDVVSNDSQFSIVEGVVRWIPDHAITNCQSCNTPFNFYTWKHHCRSCGNIFCSYCSRHKSTVPKQKLDWNVRVCDKCYADLQVN